MPQFQELIWLLFSASQQKKYIIYIYKLDIQ